MLADRARSALVDGLRDALAQRRRPQCGGSGPRCSRRSRTRCARTSPPRSSCSCAACCSRTAASELLTADYTFLNERLARHYGMRDVLGPQFRAREADDDESLRLAGQGRGAAAHFLWRPHVAGAARRVGAGEAHGHAADSAAAGRGDQTLDDAGREAHDGARAPRAASRRKTCNQCHGVIDPIGLAMENFDVDRRVARLSTRSAKTPIDASTVLPNGVPIDGPVELRDAAAAPAGAVRAGVHREADDVRAGARGRILRHAAGARDRARRRAATITASPRSCWASSTATRSACRRCRTTETRNRSDAQRRRLTARGQR